jgi:hypothetical protein
MPMFSSTYPPRTCYIILMRSQKSHQISLHSWQMRAEYQWDRTDFAAFNFSSINLIWVLHAYILCTVCCSQRNKQNFRTNTGMKIHCADKRTAVTESIVMMWLVCCMTHCFATRLNTKSYSSYRTDSAIKRKSSWQFFCFGILCQHCVICVGSVVTNEKW